MTKRIITTLLIVIATLAQASATPPSNQAIDYNTLIANQPNNFTWKGSAPSGSNQLVTASQYRALVNTNTTCPQNSAPSNQIVDWNFVISCASSHTPSQQSQSFTGANYHTQYYTYNAKYQICRGPFGSDGYTYNTFTTPSGTVAPTSSSTQLSFSVSSVAWPGTSTSLTVTLTSPSGTKLQQWSVNNPGSSLSGTYYAAGAAAGSYTWTITQTGGTDGTCDPTLGASGGGTQVSWNWTVTWYQ